MKRLTLSLFLVVLVVLLAACAQQATPAPTQAPAAEPTKAPAAEPTKAPAAEPTKAPTAEPTQAPAAQPPTDPIGVVEIGPGEPIVLAYALVVAGPNASLGEDSKRGIEIALDDAGGELLGHKIELIGEDSGCSPEGGQAAATKLTANPAVVAIIGTNCSSAGRVMAPVVDQAGMVMVSPSNTAPDLTDPAKHVAGYLRTAHNDKVQGRVAAEFARQQLQVSMAATIHDGSVYAEQLANVFAASFQELGGQIVAQEAVNVGDTDMRPVLTRLASLQPELIYYPIFVAEGGFITRQAREVSGLEETRLMGADGLFSPDFIEAAGEGVKGMYLSSPDVTAFASGYQAFLDKHQQKYGEAPLSIFHAHAYDATNMILAAIEKVAVQGADGTLYIPRQGLRDALYATKNFQGLTGNLTCDENGDCADPHIAVYQVVSADTTGWPDQVVKKVFPEAEAAAAPAGEQGEPYTIGVIVAETGPASSLGVPEANTARMLEEQINAAGGVKGPDGKMHPLQIIIYDTESDETKTVLATKRLIEEDKVPVIVGPTQSGTTLAIIDTVQQAEVPLISLAAAVQIIEPVADRKWVFKTPQTDRLVVERLVEYIQSQGWSKIAFMSVSTGYGDGGRAEFMKAAENAGIEVVADERFGAQDTDMSAQLTKIQGTDADAILVWSIPPSAALVNKNAFELGLDIPILQSHGIGNKAFIEVATTEAAEGTIFPAGKLLVAEQLPDSDPQKEVLLKYKTDYEAKFGQTPSTFGGHAWDGIWWAVKAMEKAGPDRAGIRDQLEQIKDFVGITGVFNLSADDHMGLTKDALALIQIKNGEWVLAE